jgi:hypothetical protein
MATTAHSSTPLNFENTHRTDRHPCNSGNSAPRNVGCFKCRRKNTARKTDTSSNNSRWSSKLSGSCCSTYLHVMWSDLLSITLLGVLILGIYFTPIYLYNRRLLPFWPSDLENIPGTVLNLRAPIEFHYPQQKSPIPDWACATAVLLVPMVIVAIVQWRVRSVWDFHAGVIGTLKAVGTT